MSKSQPPRLPPEPKDHVRFELPPALQTFTCFSRLPQELQDEIWESAVNDPGVHWINLRHSSMDLWGFRTPSAPPPSSGSPLPKEDEDPIRLECELESSFSSTSPLLVHPENMLADKSWHLYVDKQLTTMAITSQLSREHVERMRRTADISRKTISDEGSRRFLVLDASRDLVFLEYLPANLYQSGCGLGIFFENERLSRFRNIAVRYHPEWNVNTESAKCCPQCGRFHRTSRTVTPRHLYHFLARNFPNLETVWLVDYMMIQREKPIGRSRGYDCERPPRHGRQQLPNPKSRQGQPSIVPPVYREKPRSFRATDRVFHEATQESWLIKDRVSRIKDWLQESYVRYSKLSEYAAHKKPETVKFGILGCKHNDTTPSTRPTPSTQSKRNKRRADGEPLMARKSRRKLSLSSDQGIFSFYFDETFGNDQLANLPMHYFGSGTLNQFDFVFEMGKLSLSD